MNIPGLGLLGSASLLATTRAFAPCNNPEQAAAFAGVVPHPNSSGASVHGRASIGGGHAASRRVVYLCALTDSRVNPVLRDFDPHFARAS